MSKNKKAKVEKVSKETKVNAEDLNRLPVEALDKLDAMTPDEDDVDIFSEEDNSELPTDIGSNESEGDNDNSGNENVDPSEHQGGDLPNNSNKVLVGYHPITKEPVYR